MLVTQGCCGVDYFGNLIEKRAALLGPTVLWEKGSIRRRVRC